MKQNIKEVEINGIMYVPKDSIQATAEPKDGMPYVLIRTYSAGVHCGYLKSKEGKEVVLLEAIRLWKWVGASACSQLAMEGVKNPEKCQFEMPTNKVTLTEAIEIHEMTESAEKSIKGVKSWKQ